MADAKTTREEPPNPSSDINELCSQARIGASVMGGWGENPGVHPTVAYSCRGAAKLIDALVDVIRLRYEATPVKAIPLLSSFGNYYRVYVEFEAQEVGPRFPDRADAQRFADEIMNRRSK